jgi:hypothetical protein
VECFAVLGCWISVFNKLPSCFEIRSKLAARLLQAATPSHLLDTSRPLIVLPLTGRGNWARKSLLMSAWAQLRLSSSPERACLARANGPILHRFLQPSCPIAQKHSRRPARVIEVSNRLRRRSEYSELLSPDTLALGAEKRISPAWIKFISTILTIRLW